MLLHVANCDMKQMARPERLEPSCYHERVSEMVTVNNDTNRCLKKVIFY